MQVVLAQSLHTELLPTENRATRTTREFFDIHVGIYRRLGVGRDNDVLSFPEEFTPSYQYFVLRTGYVLSRLGSLRKGNPPAIG